jgi:tetratricopeptide (TPR) repeat protein
MRHRPAADRWLLALALTACLLSPAGLGRAEEAAAPAAQPAAGKPEDKAPEAGAKSAEDRPLSEAEEEKLDAEDEKRREHQAKEQAQDQKKWRAKTKEETKEAEAAQVRTVGRRTGRFLAKASQLFTERKYDESNEVLGRLNLKRLNPYERSLVYKYQGYNAYGKEQVSTAIEFLRKVLAEKGPDGNPILPKQDASDLLFQISQMQMGAENYEDAIATLKEWFATAENPGAVSYFTLAIAYYQMKDMDNALEPAKKAIELAENPQQGWLQLVLAIYLNKEDYAAATPVLAQLLSRYPDVGKAYWLQLATLYGVQKDIPRALAVMQIAHRKKLLDEDTNVRRLASLLQSEDIPIRSVHVLEQGFAQKVLKEDEQAYELLGNSWILARESDNAEKPLEKAAELSTKGALYVRLGQVRLLKENYDGAASALKNALAKGGLDDPGSAEMLLGITYFNAGKLGEAKNWFTKSKRSEKARPVSEQWLKHIDEELQKQNGDSNGAAGSVGL